MGMHGVAKIPYWGTMRSSDGDRLWSIADCRAAGDASSGMVISSQIRSAVLMRRAPSVRVIPEEGGSYEENPPTLPDFIARETRWCPGNLQYKALLTLPGLRPMGRLQLLLAMLMYLPPVAWMSFVFLGLALAVVGHTGPALAAGSAIALPWGAEASTIGLALLGTMLFMTFAPKIMGVMTSFFVRNGALPWCKRGSRFRSSCFSTDGTVIASSTHLRDWPFLRRA